MGLASDGSCTAQFLSEVIYCRAEINPYTLRPLTSLHGDQMHEVLLYMAGEDAKIARLHAKAGLLKRGRLCEMQYLHPKNTPIHLSRRMPLSCRTPWLLWSAPPSLSPWGTQYYVGARGTRAPAIFLVNVNEMQRVCKLLRKSPEASKVSLQK